MGGRASNLRILCTCETAYYAYKEMISLRIQGIIRLWTFAALSLKTPNKFQARSQISQSLWRLQMLDLCPHYITKTGTNSCKVPENSVLKELFKVFTSSVIVKCGVIGILHVPPTTTTLSSVTWYIWNEVNVRKKKKRKKETKHHRANFLLLYYLLHLHSYITIWFCSVCLQLKLRLHLLLGERQKWTFR